MTNWITCKDCGASVRDGLKICPKCGESLRWYQIPTNLALLSICCALAIFLSIISPEFRGLLILIGVVAAVIRVRRNTNEERQAAFERAHQALLHDINAIYERHKATLVQHRRRLITVDAYGWVDRSAWDSHFAQFVERHLLPMVSQPQTMAGRQLLAHMIDSVEGRVEREQARQDAAAPSLDVDVASMDPIEYERYCARLLATAGWKARPTQASSDQGVDVVAEKDGFLAVFQVKRYQSNVGNASVQEIIAAKTFMRAHGAAVVCYSDYTRSARELAASASVLLLHHKDLPFLEPGRFDG